MTEQILLAPQPGPQSMFAACPADICLYGGAAGGGKSYALLLEAAKWITVPDYGGVIFRRTSDQFTGAGSMWEEAKRIYGPLGAGFKNTKGDLEARWDETNAIIQFRHLEHEDDKFSWQGKELAFVGFDELTHFTESQFWYIYTRQRTKTGIRPYMRATTNPDPDSFVRKLIDWWIDADGYAIPERSGVIRWLVRVGDELRWFDAQAEAQAFLDEIEDTDGAPVSFTFVLSRLEDNPALTKADPGYRGRLAIQDAETRARLLGANWNARSVPGGMFRREWYEAREKPPARSEIAYSLRGWDTAATSVTKESPDPDWTYSTRLDVLKNGKICVSDATCLRGPPGEVDEHMASVVAMDGPDVVQCFWIDPGSSGKVDQVNKSKVCTKALPTVRARFVKESKSKVAYAKPWSAFCDPETSVDGRAKMTSIVRADWNAQWLLQHEKFPTKGVHDDAPDSSSRAYYEVHKTKTSSSKKMLDAMANMR